MKNHTPKKPDSDLGYWFSKDKLQKGFSYPLKRSALDVSLKNVETDLVSMVWYHRAKANSVLMACVSKWQLDNRESISLSVHAVPSAQRRSYELLLRQFALPMLENWIKNWNLILNVHPAEVDRPPLSLTFYVSDATISVHEKYEAKFRPDSRYEIGRIRT